MGKIPNKPEDIFDEFCTDYTNLFGDELISIILYGSGARGEYVPKKSDINFFIVLRDNGVDNLDKSLDLVAKWGKRSVAAPLFLSEDFLDASLDTFPLEFFNIRLAYRVVYGKDVLKNLDIEKDKLRLQCERELKAKLILLRRLFLEANGEPRLLVSLIKQSISAFISIFNALLYLENDEIPLRHDDIVKTMKIHFTIDDKIFQDLLAIKKGEKTPGKEALKKIVWSYIIEVKELSKMVDKMELYAKQA